jgi:hypothetical protein
MIMMRKIIKEKKKRTTTLKQKYKNGITTRDFLFSIFIFILLPVSHEIKKEKC